jgi:hypothetical protein
MKMAAFWIVALCSLVEAYRRFRGIAASIIWSGQGSALTDWFLYLKPIPRAWFTHFPDDGGSKYL